MISSLEEEILWDQYIGPKYLFLLGGTLFLFPNRFGKTLQSRRNTENIILNDKEPASHQLSSHHFSHSSNNRGTMPHPKLSPTEKQKLLDYIGDRIVVAAISGGKDSAAMALFLKENDILLKLSSWIPNGNILPQ